MSGEPSATPGGGSAPVAVRPDRPTPPSGPPSGVLTGTARLYPDATASRRARVLMGEWLGSWWGPRSADPVARAELRDRLALVLSELVGNAVLHGQHAGQVADPEGSLEVELYEFDRTVRLVVSDRSSRRVDNAFRPPASPALPSADSENGRGLFIVDQLADGWNAEPTSAGLMVWCDFVVEP